MFKKIIFGEHPPKTALKKHISRGPSQSDQSKHSAGSELPGERAPSVKRKHRMEISKKYFIRYRHFDTSKTLYIEGLREDAKPHASQPDKRVPSVKKAQLKNIF